MRIDINSDTGESFGAYTIGHDAGLFRSITSANVAAGFHAGDPSVLRATIRLAKTHGVAVGAHPGFPDLVGFGRRELNVTPQEAEDFVLYQIAAVAGVAAAEGVKLQHVKPHGALFNMAVRNTELARRDREGGRRVRHVADPVRPARIGNPERRPRRRSARRRGSVRRSRVRARRLARLAPQARLRHPRRRGRRRARGAHGDRRRRSSRSTARSCRSRPTRSACTATRRARTSSPRRFAPASKPPVLSSGPSEPSDHSPSAIHPEPSALSHQP